VAFIRALVKLKHIQVSYEGRFSADAFVCARENGEGKKKSKLKLKLLGHRTEKKLREGKKFHY
jgi:hypothetical protein